MAKGQNITRPDGSVVHCYAPGDGHLSFALECAGAARPYDITVKALQIWKGGNEMTLPREITAGRKADREKIAAALVAVAAFHGAIVERRDEGPNPGYHGASIALRITHGRLGAMIDVDDLYERHGSRGSLIHWHPVYGGMRDDPGNLSDRFRTAARDYRGRPHHKATTACDSWGDMVERLGAGLAVAAAGDAWDAPEHITAPAGT